MSYYSESILNKNIATRTNDRVLKGEKANSKNLSIRISDKAVIIFFIATLVFTFGLSINNGMSLTEIDYKKEKLYTSIQSLQELNRDLEIKIADLTSTERIYDIAVNELGMVSTPSKNIKVINKVRVAELGM